ncbi:MAG: hypothetical protein U1A78_26565 [Polyangia bacterium]
MSTSSPAPLSRCPTTDRLVELLDGFAPDGASGGTGAPDGSGEHAGAVESLPQHTADCPLCSVTWAKVQAGYAALGELTVPAPQPASLERLARAVLPEVTRDLAPRRRGPLALGPVGALLMLLVLAVLGGAVALLFAYR